MPDREFRRDPSPRERGDPRASRESRGRREQGPGVPGDPPGSLAPRRLRDPRDLRDLRDPGDPREPGLLGAAGPAALSAPLRSPNGAETAAERRRRRAEFLRELTEARELRARVHPRRTKAARLRHEMLMRTFRY